MSDQRIAVVTGAARGIGAAIAQRLAADGHTVGVVDLNEESCQPTIDAIVSSGGSALAVGADVSNEAAVTAAIDRITTEAGAPTILVNNAVACQRDGTTLLPGAWDHLESCVSIT